jgi:uncharacterized membrane protein
MKYLPWVILLLPIATVLILWNHLPAKLPIHFSSNGPDQFGSRDDFGALVLAVTAIFALIPYVLLQVVSSFQPISERGLNKAYLAITAGSSLIGFAIIVTGLSSAR